MPPSTESRYCAEGTHWVGDPSTYKPFLTLIEPDNGTQIVRAPDPYETVRQNITEFCREARRLRAVFVKQPGRLHEHLRELRVVDLPEIKAPVQQVVIERLDTVPDAGEWPADNHANTYASSGFGDMAASRPVDSSAPVITIELEEDSCSAENASASLAAPWMWLNGARVGSRATTALERVTRIHRSAETSQNIGKAAEIKEEPPSQPKTEAVGPSDAPPTADALNAPFAEYVAERLSGPVLPYSQRLAILREASRRGIGRFEANLVIAAVQHRHGKKNHPRVAVAPVSRKKRRWLVTGVAAALAFQSLILLGMWRMVHG